MKRLRQFIDRRKSQGSSYQAPLQNPPQPDARPAAQTEGRFDRHETQRPAQYDVNSGLLQIALRNDSSSSNVRAYITGQAIDHNNAIFLLQADGHTPYYPTSPPAIGSALQQNCAIPLGAPGNTTTVQIPHVAGGRIWFAIDGQLTFLLNPGPALVEPSVSNFSDPNINVDWGFCEFTWNRDQLYANISYVDFVSLPISLQLDTVNSGTQHVSGMAPDGINRIAEGLRAQHNVDHAGWDQLIISRQNNPSQVLRILSPNQGTVVHPNLFETYYDSYVNQVFAHYNNTSFTLDTQAAPGEVQGHATTQGAAAGSVVLNVGGHLFTKPSTRDIFTCSTGPFATGGNADVNAIIPRIAAAFNRSTFLETNAFPAPKSLYYKSPITNHYSRIVHEANLDGKGYAFPYDDVQPSGGPDQSGEVHAGDPKLFTIAVGGGQARA